MIEMSTTAVILLGVIAVGTLTMALIQVGLIVYAARLARKVEELSVRLEQDIRPLVADATTVSGNAARASALGLAQLERADRVFSDLAARVDQTAAVLQGTLLAPAREGRALLAGVGAALAAFQQLREASARQRALRADDEDPLFIG